MGCIIVYPGGMLTGIRIYSGDAVWRSVLADLNAVVVDAPDIATVIFDELNIPAHCTILELKAAILAAMDNTNIIQSIFGRNVALAPLQRQIIVLLQKSGGMTGAQLRTALGYSPRATTHTVDTAIYQLRKVYGHDLIKNIDGVYTIGRI